MRGANNRQTTIQRMRAIKRASKSIQYRKGSKRVPLSRRPPGKP